MTNLQHQNFMYIKWASKPVRNAKSER